MNLIIIESDTLSKSQGERLERVLDLWNASYYKTNGKGEGA